LWAQPNFWLKPWRTSTEQLEGTQMPPTKCILSKSQLGYLIRDIVGRYFTDVCVGYSWEIVGRFSGVQPIDMILDCIWTLEGSTPKNRSQSYGKFEHGENDVLKPRFGDFPCKIQQKKTWFSQRLGMVLFRCWHRQPVLWGRKGFTICTSSAGYHQGKPFRSAPILGKAKGRKARIRSSSDSRKPI
jgi:hypothetical protein